jgi:hypothetical protein
LAPVTAAPPASLTVPVIEPAACWAFATGASESSIAIKPSERENILVERSNFGVTEFS